MTHGGPGGLWEVGVGWREAPLLWVEGRARNIPACRCYHELVLTSGAGVARKTGRITVMPSVTFLGPVSSAHDNGSGHRQTLSSCGRI